MVFICCIVLLQIVESDEVRISKKKTVLFVIVFLLLAGFVLGILYLKSVADYRQAVRETLTFWSTGMNVERPQKLSLTA